MTSSVDPRRCRRSLSRRVRAGGVEKDVVLVETDDADHDASTRPPDQVRRYARGYMDPALSPSTTTAMLRLIAR